MLVGAADVAVSVAVSLRTFVPVSRVGKGSVSVVFTAGIMLIELLAEDEEAEELMVCVDA